MVWCRYVALQGATGGPPTPVARFFSGYYNLTVKNRPNTQMFRIGVLLNLHHHIHGIKLATSPLLGTFNESGTCYTSFTTFMCRQQ